MQLEIIDDLIKITNLQHDLIKDLVQELERRPEPEETGTDGKSPTIKERVEETERLLDIAEYNIRRL